MLYVRIKTFNCQTNSHSTDKAFVCSLLVVLSQIIHNKLQNCAFLQRTAWELASQLKYILYIFSITFKKIIQILFSIALTIKRKLLKEPQTHKSTQTL